MIYLTHKRRMKIYRDVMFKSLAVGLIIGTVIASVVIPKQVMAKLIDPTDVTLEGVMKTMNSLPPTPITKPEYQTPEVDKWVAFYSDKFGKTPSEKNHTRVLLHCLLFNESGYGSNKGHGDSGLAGGPLQYHQGTWDGFRGLMIKQGFTNTIGSRYDMEQAISTTAWAITHNRANNWGPVLRGECK